MMRRYFNTGLTTLVLAAGILFGSPGASRGQERATPRDTSGLFGLNAVGFFHYRDQPDATRTAQQRMDALKRAGATWDRFDFWWGEIEPQKGTWKWDKADWLIDFYTRNHVQMLPILCYQAAWMQQSPHTPQDYADYADYVGHMVARYKDRVHTWEIWNEPNIPTFWKPHPDPVAYTEMLKAAYTAAHQADPDCVVVGAAANETDINWLRDIAANGGMKATDAVSIHPYSMADGPEQMDLARQLENVKTFLKTQGRPDLPVWITEMGWQSSVQNAAAMDQAGRYMVQSYVIAAAEGVAHLFWFNLQDWMEGGKLEGWGLLSPEGKPKTTLAVYRRLADTLAGATFEGTIPLDDGIAYRFRQNGIETLVAWAHHDTSVKLALRGSPRVTDLQGHPVPLQNANLNLTENPIFIEGGLDVIAAAAPPARRPAPEAANLVVNGDFALLTDRGLPYGWHQGVFYGGADKGTFGVAVGGDAHVAISLSHTKDALWESYPLPALPGEHYTLTAEIKTTEATGENGVQILFLSGPGWGWKGGPTSPTVTGTSADWKTVTITGTVPDDADVVRVNLISKNNTGTVLFRHIHLMRQ